MLPQADYNIIIVICPRLNYLLGEISECNKHLIGIFTSLSKSNISIHSVDKLIQKNRVLRQAGFQSGSPILLLNPWVHQIFALRTNNPAS